MSENVNPVKYFLSGGFGGVCTILVGHPLDTIKVRLQTMSIPKPGEVRLQTMPIPKPGEVPLYTGTLDCAKQTLSKEGFRGFYKGMGAPLVGVAPIFAMSFLGFGIGKKLQQSEPNEKLSELQIFYAGAFSGIFTTVIMAPGERIKCLLQIQHGDATPKYNGPVDCIKKLYAEGGLRSIFKGSCATLLRDVPASGMYFTTYEVVKRSLAKEDGSVSLVSTLTAGASAGIANWIVGMPPDVLKSRLQTAPEGTYTRGVREVFVNLMKTEGPAALYKGFTPVMLRAVPANAACFLGFEAAKNFLDWLAPNY